MTDASGYVLNDQWQERVITIVQLTGDPTASLPTNLASVSVQSGDTLGSIALHYAPHADAGAVIARIQELNGLTSSAISPGQVLVVPAGL